MRRVLLYGFTGVAVLLAAGLAGADFYFLQQIRTYEPITLEAPYERPDLIDEFALDGRRDPGDFGFSTFSLETYASDWDDVTLEGWFVPAADTSVRRALVLAHGRWSNRLKPLSYLPIVREAGLDSLYHVFLPDLRNSGGSTPAPTEMGHAFAEDLLFTLRHLHHTHGIDRFVVYGFSMGAMATAILLDRPDLQAALLEDGLTIDGVILDSPLTNVEGALRAGAARQAIPEPILDLALMTFDATLDGYLGRMRLGTLLAEPGVPVLVLQGTADQTTPLAALQAEQSQFGPDVTVHTFDEASHVKIYRQPEHRARYTTLVADFLRTAAEAS